MHWIVLKPFIFFWIIPIKFTSTQCPCISISIPAKMLSKFTPSKPQIEHVKR